jgi:hypothetical protein
MKESMISLMASLMKFGGSSGLKDNLYVRTRLAIQDTVSLFYVIRALQASPAS